MHWKIKAAIQQAIGGLPNSLGDWINFQLQKRVGILRELRPEDYINPVTNYLERITNAGRSVEGKAFLEVGTGRRATTALFLWLCGAGNVITVDLNRLFNDDIFMNDVSFIVANEARIRELLGPFAEDDSFHSRYATLKKLVSLPDITPQDILNAANIDYRAPGDARNLDLPDASVDYHISANVFEHIPARDLTLILNEATRILTPSGMLMHFIDYADHFRTIDPAISQINFLQYSDAEWSKWAGNRFAYHNRLRSDDFQAIFAEAGFQFIDYERRMDDSIPALLASGSFRLADRFASKPADVLACVGAFVVAEKMT